MLKTSSIKNLLENTLFVWMGLVLILAIGSDRILLPDWIQVIGRSHPLLLHFPIVLLLLGLLFVWIPGLDQKPDARSIFEFTLLAGCNFAGLTVIAGLILVNEDYDGDAILWHQWSGIAIFYLCIVIYFFRHLSKSFLKPASLLLALGITLTGHWGANITHGEDFLLAPIQEKESEITPLAEAEVFNDLVRPILESKCMSCHKEGKIKGELRMDYIEGLQKGGKSGPFVLAGDFENSHMIQRIGLHMEEKKHMPPKNKAQLTEDELIILREWVANGASFDQKVMEIAPDSKLFILASNKFEAKKIYNFEAADASDIKSLNNFFRKVEAFYPESPALEVSYFSIAAFDPNSLEELKKVKDQVVKLNLNKMPLAGVDLSVLKEMTHLEEIQANFTDLDSKQIQLFASLENLKYLAISGNPIDEIGVQAISEMKPLISLYLWTPSLSDAQKKTLQSKLPNTSIDFGFDGSEAIFPLNSPKVTFDKMMFRDSMEVVISHPIKTVDIRYTLDGSEPDSLTSPHYSEPIWLTKTGTLRAKVFAKDWIGSPEANFQFLKSGLTPREYQLLSTPNKQYKGNGVETLFDQIKGQNNHTTGEWLGFQDEAMELELKLNPETNYSELVIGMLYHEGAHIFPPASVEIKGLKNGIWKTIVSEIPEQSKKVDLPRSRFLNYDLSVGGYESLRIKLNPIRSLPKWHPASGSKGWVFVDEILLN
jgi:uncharacterized membrane protein